MPKTLLNIFKIIIPIFLLFVSLDYKRSYGKYVIDLQNVINELGENQLKDNYYGYGRGWMSEFGRGWMDEYDEVNVGWFTDSFSLASEMCNSGSNYICDVTFIVGGTEFVAFAREKNSGSCNFFENAGGCNQNGNMCVMKESDTTDQNITQTYQSGEIETSGFIKCGVCTNGGLSTIKYSLIKEEFLGFQKGVLVSVYNNDAPEMPPIERDDFACITSANCKEWEAALLFDIIKYYLVTTADGSKMCLSGGDTNCPDGHMPDRPSGKNATACYREGQFYNYEYLGLGIWVKGDDVPAIEIKENYGLVSELFGFSNEKNGLGGKSETFQDSDNIVGTCLSKDSNRNVFNFTSENICKDGDIYLGGIWDQSPMYYRSLFSDYAAYPTIYCASSFIVYNQSQGRHCIANIGDGFEPCGKKIPIPGYTDIYEVQICAQPSESKLEIKDNSTCVGNNYDDNDNYIYGTVDGDTLIDYPDSGICLDCVEDGEECIIYDENDKTSNDNYVTEYVNDNCCDNDLVCMPDTENKNTCQNKPEINKCEGDTYIPSGEVCNYKFDDTTDSSGNTKKINDHCGNCSVVGSIETDSDGNDVCPVNSWINDPGLTEEYADKGCTADCGCPISTDGTQTKCIKEEGNTTGICQLNSCMVSNREYDQNLYNNTSKECCNKNYNIEETNGTYKCIANCSVNNPCNPECCASGSCNIDYTGCDNSDERCSDESVDGCCGPNKKCNDNLRCVITNDPNCIPTSGQRPPKGGYGRPPSAFSLVEFIEVIISILYPLSIILGMTFVVIGGYKVMISKGDPKGVKQAQETLTNAILGMLFVIMSATLLRFVLTNILGI